MNAQRWLAAAVVGGILAAIVTRPLWGQAFTDDDVETVIGAIEDLPATPAPFSQEPPASKAILPTPLPLTAMEQPGEAMMMEEPQTVPGGTGGPFILAQGDFVEIDAIHGGTGTATIYQAPDGSRFVHLEPFSVTDSPDLRVLLASHPAPRTPADLTSTSGYVDLGALLSLTSEAQQDYQISANVRLEQFQSVVIFDKTFNIIFTTATLQR